MYTDFMSFGQITLKDKPVSSFMLDTTPFIDISGYGRSATHVGASPTFAIGLIKGAAQSVVFGNGSIGKIESPLFLQGKEKDSFTLEVTVRAIRDGSSTAAQQILGHLNQMDGIILEGNTVSFVTKYLTAPQSKVSYDIQQDRSLRIVATHIEDKNSLYIDGKLVAEVSLSPEQQADRFITTDGFLYSGTTSGGQKIAVNGVNVYASALVQDAVTRHFQAATTNPNVDDIATGFGGYRIPVSLYNASLFVDHWWTSEMDWQNGSAFNILVKDATLAPQFNGDVSIPGQWMTLVPLGRTDATSIHGVAFNWDGKGVLIEVSLDGDTWEAVKRGVNIGMIPPGFNPTGQSLQIRVSFSGGIQNDDSFLDNLNIVGLISGQTPSVHGRTVTYSNSYQEREYRPLDLHDNWGAELATNISNIEISSDESSAAVPVRTIEMFIKRFPGTGVPGIQGATGTSYYNGKPASSSLEIGNWTLWHLVVPANITGPITITGPAQVGNVTLYEAALTATDIADIYSQYLSTTVYRITDSNPLEILEDTDPAKFYAHDWAIMASG